MDIIFQSGQFYGENSSFFSVLSSFLGALITGGIAILIFYKGNKYNELKDKRKRLLNLKEYQSLISSSCNLIYIAINEQIKKISDHSKTLKDFNSKVIKLSISPSLTTEDFNYLDNKILFDLFVTHKKGENRDKVTDYLQFKNAIRHLERNVSNFHIHNEKIERNLEHHRSKWNENIKILNDLHNQYILESRNSRKANDEFLNRFNKIIISYPKYLNETNQNDNIAVANSILVKNLFQFLKSYNNLNDKRIAEVIIPLQQCDIAYKETASERYNRRLYILKHGRNIL